MSAAQCTFSFVNWKHSLWFSETVDTNTFDYCDPWKPARNWVWMYCTLKCTIHKIVNFCGLMLYFSYREGRCKGEIWWGFSSYVLSFKIFRSTSVGQEHFSIISYSLPGWQIWKALKLRETYTDLCHHSRMKSLDASI